jgi:hypothetical protein
MIARTGAGLLFGSALFLSAEVGALAETPTPTNTKNPGQGAVVVAVGPDGAAPARSLARDVYRDAALKPDVDDATARVLIGEEQPPPAAPSAPAAGPGDAAAKLRELGELRASVSGAGSDAAARRLLAAIGADLKARVVVSVTMEGGRPVAKVLRVETSAFEGVELGATVETTPSGEKLYQWPGALETLRKLVPAAETGGAAASAPLRPTAAKPSASPAKSDSKPGESKSVWSSPWFWVTLGGVVAVGATVFAVAKATEADGGTLRLQGRVAQ